MAVQPSQETGIGKAVNSFRKHSDVGDVAKSLVSKWKKLVPIENQSDPKGQPYDVNDSLQSPIPKSSKLSYGKIKVSESAEIGNRKSSHSNESKPQNAVKIKDTAIETDEKSLHHGKPPKNSDPKKNEEVASDMPLKICIGRQSKSESVSSKPVTGKKDQLGHNKGILQTTNEFPKLKISNSLVESAHQKDNPKMDVKLDGEDFDPPTMSFESYLNYDQASGKRKKKNSLTENSKKIKTELLKVPENKTIEKEKIKSKPDLVPESQVKKVNLENLEDLLDVPQPKFLPYYASFQSLTYESDKGTAPETVSQEHSDMNSFIGKRLNSKMQVYSGSKPIFLSKMLTLYEQCLRVLQNNINSLHEVRGAPFEILEPVLERCTPEQLYRIEGCNPTFVEESDHLWKKHCQKDFRIEHLLEYESWREMYLRLFSEREEKLQKIIKDISSAHSGKPKGRQVKLADVHSSAKPPCSIRRKQEIFGNAAPIAQPYPIDRMKMQKLERERKKLSSSSNASTSTASVAPGSRTNGPSQQNRRPPAPPLKKVAPMMAKSLRAFKNRFGPR